MEAAEFAQFAVGGKAEVRGREVDHAERGPEVFAEAAGDGFLAEEGELL